jgi:hypothetical protein
MPYLEQNGKKIRIKRPAYEYLPIKEIPAVYVKSAKVIKIAVRIRKEWIRGT